ncbi:Dihydroneopterin aldolase [Sinobacterium norvegicum]|uniref:7,8-dihydroneopterin aldolase n=1 Tax=Sinobacterium norvegicum TaxID=1641715 RepID=A0ABM9AFX1_9GAMM|nr:dihydroneopterin aldolase [Sinobacterium norvegicum]CAH0992110.1 Dihydroneopterin aldolase [Sinobacterium norvegicum]
MDIVFIRELKIDTVIGIFDWEREIKQTVAIDLDMAHDFSRAADTDSIDYALSYKDVSDRLVAFIEASEFFLIETMAEQIAEIIMTEFSVPWLRLQLSKPGAVPAASNVGVVIERGEKR